MVNTLGGFQVVPLGVFEGSRAFSVVNVDNDDDLDLVVANEVSANVGVFINNGGVLQLQKNVSTGGNPVSVLAEDINQDGFLDVVTANSLSDNVSVILGGVDLSFGTPLNFSVGSAPLVVVVADLNGDSFLDLITANGASDDVSVRLSVP